MNLTSKIYNLQKNIVDINNLSGLCYNFIHRSLAEHPLTLLNQFSGAIEKVAAYGYMATELDSNEIELAFTQINSKHFEKLISIYHVIGFCLQCRLSNNHQYQGLLHRWFSNHSYRIQFLISLVFEDYQTQFRRNIMMIDDNDSELLLLKSIVNNRNGRIPSSEKIELREDIITLLILENYEERKRVFYDKDKAELLDLVIFSATEIQSKHRVLNNNEDQFNGLIHSLLSKDFIAESQSQRGVSASGKSYGELDLAIYTKEENYPLGIIEAFILKGIDRAVISKHLKKLTVSYDPNGLTRNYVIVYSRSKDFQTLWKDYLTYVSTYPYDFQIIDKKVHDVSKNFPTFSNLRIGVGNHLNGDTPIELYHIFISVK
jgi:hypothetical protein